MGVADGDDWLEVIRQKLAADYAAGNVVPPPMLPPQLGPMDIMQGVPPGIRLNEGPGGQAHPLARFAMNMGSPRLTHTDAADKAWKRRVEPWRDNFYYPDARRGDPGAIMRGGDDSIGTHPPRLIEEIGMTVPQPVPPGTETLEPWRYEMGNDRAAQGRVEFGGEPLGPEVQEFTPPAGLVQFIKSQTRKQGINDIVGTEGARGGGVEGGGWTRAYHGTTTGPTSKATRFHKDPYAEEPGVFFTPDPVTASQYAGFAPRAPYKARELMLDYHKGGKVFPVELGMTPKNTAVVDLAKIIPESSNRRMYDPQYVKTAIETAKQNNKEFVVIKNMVDVGGAADQIIAIKPAGKVRSAITKETLYGLLGLSMAGGFDRHEPAPPDTTMGPRY